MAHSKPNLILALLLLSTACPGAGATVMRVHVNGEVEALESESVTGLENMFSDDPEAKAVTAKLLEGTPSEDLLPFVQRLKEQIQPWHGTATASLNTAIEDIASCTAGMENGMRETDAKRDSCSAKGTSHATHRTDESTKFTTKEHWKAETAEKKEQMTTECNAFDSVGEEAKAATASYSGGDPEAYLERVEGQFCNDLLPRYKEHKEKCTTATAEHVSVSETYETKNTEYTVQKTASDTVQTEMDVTCCEYALATKDVCTSHDTCYEDKVAAYNAVKAIVEAEEKIKKVEWRVYSRIECLLPVLGTDQADKIEECRANTHSTSHLDIDYPTIPEKSTCKVEQAFPGTDAYHSTHFASLPDNAKGEAVAVCTGMTGGSTIAVAQSIASAGPAIKVSSAGFTVGNYVHFLVKGEEVALNINSNGHRRGLHFATLNQDLSVKSTGAFDAYAHSGDVTKMINYVNAIPAGTLVIVGCWDECSNKMTGDAYAALRSVGATDQTLSFRQSFALVGVKDGQGIEKHSTTGPVDVEVSANKVQELLGSVPTQYRFWKLEMRQNDNPTCQVFQEIEFICNGEKRTGVNAVEASGTYLQYHAQKVVDGNENTYWAKCYGGQGAVDWITFDLGSPCSLTDVKTKSRATGHMQPDVMLLQASTTGEDGSWDDIHQWNNPNNPNWQEIEIPEGR